MNSLIVKMVGIVITKILSSVTKDVSQVFLDKIFDAAEDAIAKSENTVDDAVLLPAIEKIRELFDIPDND